MAESTLARYLVNGLKKTRLVHLTRHEDVAGAGTPDVSYGATNEHSGLKVNGWIELKEVRELPKRSDTPIRVKLSPAQRIWLRARQAMGGRCFVLVRVNDPRQYFLFEAHKIHERTGLDMPLMFFFEEALQWWASKIDFHELQKHLAFDRERMV